MVGADKGGVGKTTVTRVLTDYLAVNGIDSYQAFDTEAPNGNLKRFLPGTQVIDLSEVSEQMKVFDSLQSNKVTIIDVRATLLSSTLNVMANVGLLDMVKTNQVSLIVFHVLGPSLASLDEIEATAKIIEGATHYLVKNHINDTEFFKWDDALYQKAFSAARSGVIEVPQLTELATEAVEVAGVSFTKFVDNVAADGTAAKNSMVLRGYVRTWLKAVYDAFNKASVNGIIAASLT